MRAYQVASGVVMLALIGVAAVAPRLGAASPAGVSECPADVVGNGVIDIADLVEVVRSLGPCRGCPAELTGDGVVDAADVMAVVAALGGCASIGEPDAVAGGGPGHVCALEDGSFATIDGGCKDLATGLVWSTFGMGNGPNWRWNLAADLIDTSTEAGFDDWRMPTLNEWLDVIDNGAATHFGGYSIGLSRYWSSTTQGNKAWTASIGTGGTSLDRKKNFMHFAGVREVAAPDPCNNNGICETGENCDNCDDCPGKSNGPPSGRYCCGNGIEEPAEGDGTICDGNY